MQQGVAHRTTTSGSSAPRRRTCSRGLDLYAAYPAEHFDFYKYSPTFALLFAPFAYVPFAPAMLLWNALNAGALYVAIGLVLPRRAATVARASCSSTCSARSRTCRATRSSRRLVFMFAAYERHHTALGSLAAVTGTYVKLFPMAGVSFAVFHPRKLRVAIAVGWAWRCSRSYRSSSRRPIALLAQYEGWRAIQATDSLNRGYTVMQMIEQITRAGLPELAASSSREC